MSRGCGVRRRRPPPRARRCSDSGAPAGVERDDRIAGIGERPVHRVAGDTRDELVAVAHESERAQRLVDEDRVAQREVGRFQPGATGCVVRAHPDQAVPRGRAARRGSPAAAGCRSARSRARNSRIDSAVSPSVMPAPSDSGAEPVGGCLRARLADRDRAQPQVERGRERTGRDRRQVGLQVDAIDLGREDAPRACRCRAAARRAATRSSPARRRPA